MKVLKTTTILLSTLLLAGATYTTACSGSANADTNDDKNTEQEAETTEEGEDGDEKKEKAPVPVEVVEASLGEVAAWISSTTNLEPERQVEIIAEVEGRILSLGSEEGDKVSSGMILATLDPDQARLAVNKATLRTAGTEEALGRGTESLDDGLISRDEYTTLRMAYEVAASELEDAEWRLGRTAINAPFSGQVTERHVEVGQYIRPGDKLYTIADTSPMLAKIYLPEAEVLKLTKGRSVRLIPSADPELAFTGSIRQIAPVVDPTTGTVKVTIEVTNAPSQIRPGAFITVGIERERRTEVVTLPRQAVIREIGEAFVFVTDGETASRRKVSLGLEESEHVEITQGLEAGEQVVVAGQGGLKDGAKVKVLEGESA